MNSIKFSLTSDLLTNVPSDTGKSYSLLMKQNTTFFVSTLPLCVHFHQPKGPLSFPWKEFVAPFLIKDFHKIHSECKPRIIGFISELPNLDQCFFSNNRTLFLRKLLP